MQAKTIKRHVSTIKTRGLYVGLSFLSIFLTFIWAIWVLNFAENVTWKKAFDKKEFNVVRQYEDGILKEQFLKAYASHPIKEFVMRYKLSNLYFDNRPKAIDKVHLLNQQLSERKINEANKSYFDAVKSNVLAEVEASHPEKLIRLTTLFDKVKEQEKVLLDKENALSTSESKQKDLVRSVSIKHNRVKEMLGLEGDFVYTLSSKFETYPKGPLAGMIVFPEIAIETTNVKSLLVQINKKRSTKKRYITKKEKNRFKSLVYEATGSLIDVENFKQEIKEKEQDLKKSYADFKEELSNLNKLSQGIIDFLVSTEV